jgi:CRISPR-associated protein Cas1
MPKDYLLAGKMQISQTKTYLNKSKRTTIAQKFIEGASFNMLKNLKYYNNRGKDLSIIIERIEKLKEKIFLSKEIDELMGIEGNIRNRYYDAFNLIIHDHEMGNRTKQPPLNIVNSLISFGNMMCYSECLRSIHQTQLNPTISFLHEPGARRYSLALDIAEIFKPLLVDRVIFKVLNKKEIQEKDFDQKINGIILKEKGKKVFISAFENRLLETIKHRSLNRSVSYKHLVKLECYKLQKHILGIEEYKPFKMWW